MRTIYSINDSELVVNDARDGELLWAGRPLGLPPQEVAQIDGSEDAVVLLDYMASSEPVFKNLLRIRPDGSVVWAAGLPGEGVREDAYVSFELHNGCLSANTWLSNRVDLGLETGQIINVRFSK